VEITGNLLEAYKALDAKGTASLDMATMTRVLEVLENRSGRTLPTSAAIFDSLDEDPRGAVSISKLLEFNPLKQRTSLRQLDTQALWKAYSSKKSEHTRSLDRLPRWRPNAKSERPLPPDSWAEHLQAVRRKRDLRKQFREDRQGIKPEQKRELILGVAPPESYTGIREQEHRNLEVHRQRIQNAIRGCSRARFNLVEIHKQMAGLVAEKAEVNNAIRGMFQNHLMGRRDDDHEDQESTDDRSMTPTRPLRSPQRNNRTVAFAVGQGKEISDEELSPDME